MADTGFKITISDRQDAQAHITNALENKHILQWAYICRDENYTERDIRAYRFDLQRNWAEGFLGQEKYASMDEYIEAKLKDYHQVGDKKPILWQVVFIADQRISTAEVAQWFGVTVNAVITLSDSIRIADELKRIDEHEVKANFDYNAYIANVNKNMSWLMVKRSINLANIVTLGIFIFIVIVVVKLGIEQSKVHPWLMPSILGAIGILYLMINLLALRASKKNNRHISGIPFIGGIHLLIAGLISPCKWLALLCVLDYSVWSFILALRGKEGDDNE